MQLSRKALNARWAWTSAAAFAAFVVLNLLDTILKARTGVGATDLQNVPTAWGVRWIADHWASPPNSVLVGFALGFDFLFMPLYAAALYYGAVVARERYAPGPGRLRRILAAAAMAPVAGALFDACENILQMVMLVTGPSRILATLATEATAVKFAGILVGLLLAAAAVVGLFVKRKEDNGQKS